MSVTTFIDSNTWMFDSDLLVSNDHYSQIVKLPSIDPNVVSVCDKYVKRAEAGFTKYGTDTTRGDLPTLEWLNHLQDELMDATIYIERLKQELKDK